MLATQTVIIAAIPQTPLSLQLAMMLAAQADSMMKQIIGGRAMVAVILPGSAGRETEAAVAVMEKVADQPAELTPGETRKCLLGDAKSDVAPLTNDDLGAVPKTNVGALTGPPTRTHPEERGRPRCLRVTGVREKGARATIEAGVATPDGQDSLPLPLLLLGDPARTRLESAVAAMKRASVAIPLPLLLLSDPARTRLEAAVAAMKGAITPGRNR